MRRVGGGGISTGRSTVGENAIRTIDDVRTNELETLGILDAFNTLGLNGLSHSFFGTEQATLVHIRQSGGYCLPLSLEIGGMGSPISCLLQYSVYANLPSSAIF
jgi:hypothetical protein